MRTFVYEALRQPGETIRGEISADEESAATALLLKRGLHVLHLEDIEGTRIRRLELGPSWMGGIPRNRIIRFTRDLSSLLAAGLPLAQSLSRLQANEVDANMRSLCLGLRAALEEGGTFSQALEQYTGVFDVLYVNLVRAGEEGGNLAEVLDRLADVGERRDDMRARIKMAMVYPGVMLALGAVTIFVLLTFVVPMFNDVFVQTGQTLPLPTRVLVGAGNVFGTWWWAILVVAALVAVPLVRGLRSATGQRMIGDLTLNIPLLRSPASESELASLARTLGTLLENGVTMVRALDIAAETMAYSRYRNEVRQLRSQVQEGERLSACLNESPLFPSRLAGIVQVGEDSGTLPEALLRVAGDTEQRLDRELKVVMTLVEPAMIVLVGGVVGFIVMAVLLPVFELGSAFQL